MRKPRTEPVIESLEDRTVPSASPLDAGPDTTWAFTVTSAGPSSPAAATQPHPGSGPPVPPIKRVPPEVLDDWAWIFDQEKRGAFAGYRGEHIAVVGKQVVGHGNDTNAMLLEVAQRLQVPLRRVVITYAGGDWD
jgi:hypothetical protein